MDDLCRGRRGTLAAGAFMTIYPAEGRTAEVEAALLKPHPHMACWRKAEIPNASDMAESARRADLLPARDGLVADHAGLSPSWPEGGNHGFDPESPEMAAVFVAGGPAFRPGTILPAFDNVSVYPLLAHLLGVTPEPNDGDIGDVATALTR